MVAYNMQGVIPRPVVEVTYCPWPFRESENRNADDRGTRLAPGACNEDKPPALCHLGRRPTPRDFRSHDSDTSMLGKPLGYRAAESLNRKSSSHCSHSG